MSNSEKLPVLDKVKSGAAAAGLVAAITGAATNWLPGAAGLEDPINVLVDAAVCGFLTWLGSFLRGFYKPETTVKVLPK